MLLQIKKRKLTAFSGNKGLQFDKFFDGWDREDNFTVGEIAKKKWIAQFTGQKLGTSNELKRAVTRQRNLVKAQGGWDQEANSVSRVVSGLGLSHPMENGMLWHQTLGVPYIAGSSLKGMCLAWARDWLELDKEQLDRIFGSAESQGSVIFFDALPTQPVQLAGEIVTPHGNWRLMDVGTGGVQHAPSDWQTPVPSPFLAIDEGQTFQFACAPVGPEDKADCDAVKEMLFEALEWLGVGAKTAVGFGRFIVADQEDVIRVGARRYYYGIPVRVVKVSGKLASIQYEEDDEIDHDIPVFHLKPITK